MQNLLNSLFLAIIQGITEWLPVSSSGHLVLLEYIMGYQTNLDFQIALHFGTLMAGFVYFGKDIIEIVKDIISGKWSSENGKTGLMLVIASLPTGIIGILFYEFFKTNFSNLLIVSFGFAITSVFLLIASIQTGKSEDKIKIKNALYMGLAQVLSILPGISRSGSTLSSGLLSGLSEKAAMRFSFLMSIPIIFGASIYSIGNKPIPSELIWATMVSFFIGLGTIHLLFNYVLTSRKNLRWFALYAFIIALISLFYYFN